MAEQMKRFRDKDGKFAWKVFKDEEVQPEPVKLAPQPLHGLLKGKKK